MVLGVDGEHHLIVAHEVTNQGYDRHQLAPMAFKAQEATGCQRVTALADRGYFSGDQVLSCEGTGVAPVVAKTLTSSGAKRGFFTRQDFIYNAEHDHYTCPAGAKLTKAKRRADHTEDFDFYRHLSACFTCPLKSRCTQTKLRRIKRWVNEDVLDRMQDRLDRMPEAMGTGAGSNCGHARAKNSISEFSQRSLSLRRSSADKSAGSLFRDAAGDKLVNKVL